MKRKNYLDLDAGIYEVSDELGWMCWHCNRIWAQEYDVCPRCDLRELEEMEDLENG